MYSYNDKKKGCIFTGDSLSSTADKPPYVNLDATPVTAHLHKRLVVHGSPWLCQCWWGGVQKPVVERRALAIPLCIVLRDACTVPGEELMALPW